MKKSMKLRKNWYIFMQTTKMHPKWCNWVPQPRLVCSMKQYIMSMWNILKWTTLVLLLHAAMRQFDYNQLHGKCSHIAFIFSSQFASLSHSQLYKILNNICCCCYYKCMLLYSRVDWLYVQCIEKLHIYT